MTKPVPAGVSGRFRERPVSTGLRSSFAAVWVHEMPQHAAPPIVVAPDGTIDLQWIDGVLRIAGPDREAQTEMLPSGTTVIGFRFRPAAAAAWLGVPAHELVDQRPALEDLWGAKARGLADRIRAWQQDGAPIAALEAIVMDHTTDRPGDAAMAAAHALIAEGPPPGVPLVPWLGRSLGLSERTLRRRFDESFGYGPKTLDRILRYKRFEKLSQTAELPTAIAAVEAGYADQAHLVRESKRLSGFTPKQTRRWRDALDPEG